MERRYLNVFDDQGRRQFSDFFFALEKVFRLFAMFLNKNSRKKYMENRRCRQMLNHSAFSMSFKSVWPSF